MPQGTVKTFDPQTGSGSLLLDSQEELTFDAQTFARSELEELRLGQRVRIEITGQGEDRRISDVALVSF
jgi:2-phospho-L-lactate/phosphoenolpyruvate guanylyltransferase